MDERGKCCGSEFLDKVSSLKLLAKDDAARLGEGMNASAGLVQKRTMQLLAAANNDGAEVFMLPRTA